MRGGRVQSPRSQTGYAGGYERGVTIMSIRPIKRVVQSKLTTEGIRFLLVSGQPIEEPVAWYGPIVMNTEEQLRQAYAELREGTFIKRRQG